MSLRVLIVPDKFKGTLTALAAAQAIAAGWRKARRPDTLTLLPMSDGGDGFGAILSGLLQARVQTTKTVDAAGRPLAARWWWEATGRTAIIESASVIGLAQLPPGEFHPFQLDTRGLGAVLHAASEKGARRCLLGIGGSATNDGGFGLARALGWEFLDAKGEPITEWTRLHALARLRAPARTRWFEELIVAVDVQNPLLGPRGCSRIYGPQKGLTKKDFAPAEKCLRRFAEVVARDLSRNCSAEPGAGAAGGLGYGLRALLGARLQPGFDLFSRHADLPRHLRAADLVITGEGALDRSTLMGKGVGEVAHRCHKLGVPCVGLGGAVKDLAPLRRWFAQAHGLTGLTSAKQAMAAPDKWLATLAERTARALPNGLPRRPVLPAAA